MTLTTRINDDIKAAMLAKEKEKLEALRAVKAALLLEATKGTGEVSEADEIALLQRLMKQRREAAEVYDSQGRTDLSEPEKFQAAVISGYLPAQLSAAEVEAEVKTAIAQTGAAGPADMGKVMGAVNAKLKGKADGKLIADTVKTCLANL
jgi:uncharacterized protein YqeY